MSRYIDADKFTKDLHEACVHKAVVMSVLDRQPTADVVEVRHDFNVGDFCLYGFADGNNSLAIVEIVKILDDERGIAELKLHKVIKDNTGNGYFHYKFKNKELTAFNRRWAKECADLQDECDQIKANTVRKMQERLIAEFRKDDRMNYYLRMTLDQITKEILEGV